MKFVAQAVINTLKAEGQGSAYFGRKNGSHALSRDGVRQTGEQSADMLLGIADAGGFLEVTGRANAIGASFGQCRYFLAAIPEGITAFEGVLQVKDLLTSEIADLQRVVSGHQDDGPTRYELVSATAPVRKVGMLHVIVGNPANPFEDPTEESAVVYSWYPGRLTPECRFGSELLEMTPEQILADFPEATVKVGQDAIDALAG